MESILPQTQIYYMSNFRAADKYNQNLHVEEYTKYNWMFWDKWYTYFYLKNIGL